MYSSKIVLQIRDISEYQRLGLLDLAAFAAENRIASKRNVERAGTQLLLNRMLSNAPFELCYTIDKKPFLRDRSEHMSISHSHDLLAVMLDRRMETGVDIELLRNKVRRVKHKFLNHSEAHFAGDDIEKLITLWAAKEAMYKAYGRKKINFSADMEVEPFDGDILKGCLRAPDKERLYMLKKERMGQYILVYTQDEIPGIF